MASKQIKPYNCKYQAKFDEILQNVEYLKQQHEHDELQPGTIAFALATELENALITLVEYKSEGCEKDKLKAQQEKADFRNKNKSELFSFETKKRKLHISHGDFNKAVRSRGYSTARANALWKAFVELNNIAPHKRKYLKDLRKLAKKSRKHPKKSRKHRSGKKSRKHPKKSRKHRSGKKSRKHRSGKKSRKHRSGKK